MQLRLIQLLFKYASPLLLAALVLTAVVGYLRPWAPARDFLSNQAGQFPVQVGFTCNLSSCTSGQYILFPSAFSKPTSVTITQGRTDGTQVVLNRYGLLVWLARVLALTVLTWWFWLRRKPQPPNNSSKPKPLRGSA
jgi:hypothetical protein